MDYLVSTGLLLKGIVTEPLKDAHCAKLGAHKFGQTPKTKVLEGGLGVLPQKIFENDSINGAFLGTFWAT